MPLPPLVGPPNDEYSIFDWRCWCCCSSEEDMKLSSDDCVSSEEKRLRKAVPVGRSAADSVLLVMADVVEAVEDM